MIRVLDTPEGEAAEELWVSGADIRASLEVRPAGPWRQLAMAAPALPVASPCRRRF